MKNISGKASSAIKELLSTDKVLIGMIHCLTSPVGPGADEENVAEILKCTNGVIVASSLKQEGVWWNPVDPERMRAFRTAGEPALER